MQDETYKMVSPARTNAVFTREKYVIGTVYPLINTIESEPLEQFLD